MTETSRMTETGSRTAGAQGGVRAGWDELLDTLEERLRIACCSLTAAPGAPPADLGPGPEGLELPAPTAQQRLRAGALSTALDDFLRRAEKRRSALDAARAYAR